MKLKSAFGKTLEWLVKGEVSDNVMVQVILGSVVVGMVIALYPAQVDVYARQIGFLDGFLDEYWFVWILLFVKWVLPAIVGLYGARMILNAVIQSWEGGDD